jgi:hypothetical protein
VATALEEEDGDWEDDGPASRRAAKRRDVRPGRGPGAGTRNSNGVSYGAGYASYLGPGAGAAALDSAVVAGRGYLRGLPGLSDAAAMPYNGGLFGTVAATGLSIPTMPSTVMQAASMQAASMQAASMQAASMQAALAYYYSAATANSFNMTAGLQGFHGLQSMQALPYMQTGGQALTSGTVLSLPAPVGATAATGLLPPDGSVAATAGATAAGAPPRKRGRAPAANGASAAASAALKSSVPPGQGSKFFPKESQVSC